MQKKGRGGEHATSPLAISQVRLFFFLSCKIFIFFFFDYFCVSFFFHVSNRNLLENNKIGSTFQLGKKKKLERKRTHTRNKKTYTVARSFSLEMEKRATPPPLHELIGWPPSVSPWRPLRCTRARARALHH